MKKLLFAFALCFLAFQSQAQESPRFGLSAGYLNLNVKASFEGMNASVNESGFFVGGLVDVPLSGNFHLQPSVLYGNAEDSGIIFIPVMAKLYIANSGFNFQAGPQASIILEETGEEMNAFGLDAVFGAAYDINYNFFLQARYALELTNRINAEAAGLPDGVKSTINSFTIGVGYKF